MPIRRALLCVLACAGVGAQNPTFQRPRTVIPKEEQDAIAVMRRASRPRVPVPRGPLAEPERKRAQVFEAAKRSVVHINCSTLATNRYTRDVLNIPTGMGTGFVWDESGHVITNHHVLLNTQIAAEANQVEVTLPSGKAYKAQVIGRSLTHDIAVLRVFAPLEDFKPIPLGTSGKLVVGQDVLAIGNPFGLDYSLTSGIISALGREVHTGLDATIRNAIQIDAAINPGNSGGPLLDSAGRLIGMNTAITSTSGSSAGVGFSIPVDTLNRIIPALIARGQMDRPELGFTVASPLNTARLGIEKGLVVESVEPGSAADMAGLKGLRFRPDALPDLGDLIVGFQGRPMDQPAQLFDELELLPPDVPIALDVLRNGERIQVVLKPAKPLPKKPDSSI